ncbi:MAG: Trk family potassium uptake protein [Armatimonadetes bacterium]|nr:Trk family potassium uptake protein [Armatimonadota bacterium]
MARVSTLPQRAGLRRPTLSPAQTVLVGFASIIVVGAVLLSLPAAAADGRPTPLLDALFTATSATCVAGLVVLDTATHFSLFGQLVILLLIQVGGFGYMTASMLLALLVGRRIGLRERVVQAESYNLYALGGVVRFTRVVILVTLAIEAAGAALLAVRWIPELGLRGAYWGVFHAVSAFNNAGFDITNFASLTGYVTDVPVNLIVAVLLILGGLGFGVLVDLSDGLRRLTLHSKIVLATTLGLIGIGTGAVLLFEFGNAETLGGLSWPGKVLAAFFQAVTPRTAGFNTVDIGAMREPTLMAIVVLMFIGASPGGTGGGIKTTTFIAPLAVILAMMRGSPDPVLFKRRLPPLVIYKAVTIALLAVAFVVAMSILLSLSEGVSFLPALFEVVSAFGTVGLTTGLTPSLSALGKVLIITTVYTGRVGLLTLAFGLTRRQRVPRFHYSEEPIYVG